MVVGLVVVTAGEKAAMLAVAMADVLVDSWGYESVDWSVVVSVDEWVGHLVGEMVCLMVGVKGALSAVQ